MKKEKTNEIPCEQPVPGLFMLKVISAPLPPIYTTNCFIIGDQGRETLIVDPSPVDEEEYEKLVNTLSRLKEENDFQYSGIFITHHHSDHLMRSPQLASELNVPIIISTDSYRRIVEYAGPGVFDGIEIKHVNEGDTLNTWQGKKVKVYEVPGHDEGQLALAPEDMHWFLAGDLIQGAGTVVILLDEGDMVKYFHSLERIIQFDPQYVFPSHGKAQHGTRLIRKTLIHRTHREDQVLKLHQRGLQPQEMVEIMYKGVDRRLWGLALQNIQSHLKKLAQENRL